jgi:predicted transcriptional regulator YheO
MRLRGAVLAIANQLKISRAAVYGYLNLVAEDNGHTKTSRSARR